MKKETSFISEKSSYNTGHGRKRSFPAVIYQLVGLPFLLYPKALKEVFLASLKASGGNYNNKEWIKSSAAIFDILESAGVSFDITGMDNIKQFEGPAVFVGNHMSTLETFVLPAIIQPLKDVTFVVKDTLVRYPVFGPVMRSRNPVVVKRINPRDDYSTVMKEGLKRLKAGVSVIVFPQTTRSVGFDPKEFNSMGVKLARKAGVPVAPMALKTDAWMNGRRLKDFGGINPANIVHIHFGEPMVIKGNGSEEHASIMDMIGKKIAEWTC